MSNSYKPVNTTKIAVNVVTGFLGAGKTTTILSLLKNKPSTERWAVLVNEFGEIGIDAGLLAGQVEGIAIREVSGGCLCCAAGVPMRVALNQLIQKARPHRILIEPTGLGHPREILAQLQSYEYQPILDVGATLVVVDARKIADARYTENETFNQQLKIADCIVANKADCYDENTLELLTGYLQQLKFNTPMPEVVAVNYGALPVHYLKSKSSAIFSRLAVNTLSHNGLDETNAGAVEREMPATGILKLTNQGEGFVSVGWIFDGRFVFNRKEIAGLCGVILAERLKAIFKTDEGYIGFNKVDGQLTQVLMADGQDSRIEIIAKDFLGIDGLEPVLLSCVLNS